MWHISRALMQHYAQNINDKCQDSALDTITLYNVMRQPSLNILGFMRRACPHTPRVPTQMHAYFYFAEMGCLGCFGEMGCLGCVSGIPTISSHSHNKYMFSMLGRRVVFDVYPESSIDPHFLTNIHIFIDFGEMGNLGCMPRILTISSHSQKNVYMYLF
jgi:hypothetical protein